VDDLISKKDLLLATGISYGQLYRWKRKGLIPEEWFIRKSTFTGQETFFPRDKVLARVERILSMKNEDVSLDDIADAVSPDLATVALTLADVRERRLVSDGALDAFAGKHPDETTIRLGELLGMYVADEFLRSGEITLDEATLAMSTIEERYGTFEGRECDLVVVRKMGIALAMLISTAAQLETDASARLVARVNLQESAEALSSRLG
jgi:DNA-binding transcriptional MerR regulator